MTRCFPGLVESLKANLPKRYVVDGEIVIVKGDRLGFEALRVQCDVDQADEGSGGRLALPPYEICLDRAIVKRRPCHLPGPLQWGLARR